MHDGDSWETAYVTIQAGVDDIDAAAEDVWVAEGTYIERIVLNDGVMVAGGYAGTGDLRDIETYVTTINSNSASYNTVTGANDSGIDGFTVSGGLRGFYANGKSNVFVVANTFVNVRVLRATSHTLVGQLTADSSQLTA